MNKEISARKIWKYRLATMVLSSALLCSLTACLPVVMVGGTIGGSMAAIDRRTFGAQAEDRVINIKGDAQASNLVGEKGHVSVTSFNRKVLLTGEVQNEAMKQAVGNAISQIENVDSVVNELALASPSTFTSRSNDAMITGKVSASFLDAKDLFSGSLKTVTERGVVYLMGRVTEREGNRAAQVAGGVDGVQQVVKVFDHISEAELKKFTTAASPNGDNQKPADEKKYAQ